MSYTKFDPVRSIRRIKNIARMAEAGAGSLGHLRGMDIETLLREMHLLVGYLRYVEGYEIDYAIINKSHLEQTTP
jgi:hypothetical protein